MTVGLTQFQVTGKGDLAVSVSAETFSETIKCILPTPFSKMLYQNSSVTGVASLITPRLYLTDYVTAMNSKKLEELGITHIISVIEHKPNLPDFIPEIQRHHLPLSDLPEAQILHHLDTTTAFIRRALEENETNKVLVSINRFGSSLTH